MGHRLVGSHALSTWSGFARVFLSVPLMFMNGCASSILVRDVECAAVAATVQTKQWTGGGWTGDDTLDLIEWPASGNWIDSVEHWCVQYHSSTTNTDTEFHVLCGVESDLGSAVEFELEKKNKTIDGPALRVERGFAFMTFRWPLIWMQNIDAGSIGTTAIVRRIGDEVQLFLIRNAKQLGSTMLTTDCDTGLSIDSHGSYPTETLGFASGSHWDVIMIRHHKLVNSAFFQPVGTGSGSAFVRDKWYFNASLSTGTGAVEVTPQNANETEAATFLAEILNLAKAAELYVVPADCPAPGTMP